MFKILGIFFTLINVLLNYTTTTNGLNFIETVQECYEEYYIVNDQELSYGDYTLVFGIKDNDYYLSCFLYTDNVNSKQQIRIIKNDEIGKTFVSDSGVVEGYGYKVNSTESLSIYVVNSDNPELIENIKISTLVDEFASRKISGLGSKDFPKNKREVNLINQIKIYLTVFTVISCLFIVLIIFLYKTKRGRFNSHYQENYDDYYQPKQNNEQDSEEVIDTSFEVEQVNKQEIMDKLFLEFRSGDITEEELNEKLKKLWWNND